MAGEDNGWKVSVAEFRGFVKAKLESIETNIQKNCGNIEALETSVSELKQYVATKQAVQKVKASFWGFIGGLIPVLATALLRILKII